jgi:SAM-dependent methyltransferase
MPPTLRYRKPKHVGPLLRLARKLFFYGSARDCSVCESQVRLFKPYGHVRRDDAQCPVCGVVERHRFTWLFFKQRTDLFDGRRKRMLHIAPEPELMRRLREVAALDYVTADAQDPNVDVKLDLTDTGLPSSSFDVIHCSHVLEHIVEDRKAMRELSRLLSPTGWATILVPIIAERTFDDPTVTDPQERARLFGQYDHVRAYGPDFAQRLQEEGFDVTVVTAAELIGDPQQARRWQLKDEQLFLCRKSAR